MQREATRDVFQQVLHGSKLSQNGSGVDNQSVSTRYKRRVCGNINTEVIEGRQQVEHTASKLVSRQEAAAGPVRYMLILLCNNNKIKVEGKATGEVLSRKEGNGRTYYWPTEKNIYIPGI